MIFIIPQLDLLAKIWFRCLGPTLGETTVLVAFFQVTFVLIFKQHFLDPELFGFFGILMGQKGKCSKWYNSSKHSMKKESTRLATIKIKKMSLYFKSCCCWLRKSLVDYLENTFKQKKALCSRLMTPALNCYYIIYQRSKDSWSLICFNNLSLIIILKLFSYFSRKCSNLTRISKLVRLILYHFCQTQPQPQLQLSWAAIVLLSQLWGT